MAKGEHIQRTRQKLTMQYLEKQILSLAKSEKQSKLP